MLYLCRKQPPRAEKSSLSASLFEGLMMVISSIGGLHVKRWIAVEGHSYVPSLSTNVLHSSWILAGIGLTEKCQLHLRKVAPKYVRLNVGYTCIVANEY
jgi:hypothetical protein